MRNTIMNATMFHATMIEVLKCDSKFKDKKDALFPIIRRSYANSLPQCEFVCYKRFGQRYENVETRVPGLYLMWLIFVQRR